MSHHTHNLPYPIAGGLLDRLTAEWDAHGWALDDLRAFRMDGEGTPPPAGTGTETPPPAGTGTPPPPTAGATFTQADLDRIAAREKDEGRRAAERSLSEQLGCTVEEAKALIEAKRAEDLGKMSEADRKAAEADAAKAKADSATADAAKLVLTTKVERALLRAHVPDESLDYAVRAVMPDVAADASDEQIAEAVENAKKAVPALFTAAAPGTAPSGNPKGNPPTSSGDGKTGVEAGIERARRERESRNGSGDTYGGLVPLGTK